MNMITIQDKIKIYQQPKIFKKDVNKIQSFYTNNAKKRLLMRIKKKIKYNDN